MFVGCAFRKSATSLGSYQNRMSWKFWAVSVPLALAVTNGWDRGTRGLPRRPEPSPDVAMGAWASAASSLEMETTRPPGWPPRLTFLPSLLCSLLTAGLRGVQAMAVAAGGHNGARRSFPWQVSPRSQPSVIYGALCRSVSKTDHRTWKPLCYHSFNYFRQRDKRRRLGCLMGTSTKSREGHQG